MAHLIGKCHLLTAGGTDKFLFAVQATYNENPAASPQDGKAFGWNMFWIDEDDEIVKAEFDNPAYNSDSPEFVPEKLPMLFDNVEQAQDYYDSL